MSLIEERFPDIRKNVSMRDYSTFKAGGSAKYFCEPETSEELKLLIGTCKEQGLDYYVIGNGSNILFSDKGFDGVVIRIASGEFSTVNVCGNEVTCGAGALLSRMGNACTNASLKGAEFACGIPGSIGGAVYMNAGAYGGEIKDIVSQVKYLDNDGEIKIINGSDCEFGYRESVFEKQGYTILEATFVLESGDKDAISSYVKELATKRSDSQPLTVPSAGSTFKRPTGYYAGALIQEAGLKGFALDDSGAQVSPKHAGFVVNNEGKASASDIYRLICYVSDKVYENSGVRLEPEVRLIGDFN